MHDLGTVDNVNIILKDIHKFLKTILNKYVMILSEEVVPTRFFVLDFL